jgi:hypothetical protein
MDGDEKPHTEYLDGLESNEQASAVASAMLSNIMSQTKGSSIRIPVDCGREVHDYISCDGTKRDPKSSVLHGNVGTLTVVFDPMHKRYDMVLSFGGWLTPKKLQDLIPNIYTGSVTEDGSVLQASETPPTFSLPLTTIPNEGEIELHRFTVPDNKTVNVYKAGISFDDGTTDTNLMILLYDNSDALELYRWVKSWEEGKPLYAGGDLEGHDLSIIVRNTTGYEKFAHAFMHIEIANE